MQEPRLKGKLPNGEEVIFEEHKVTPNGDCGFIALGVTRQEVADKLAALADNLDKRKFLSEEILSALMLEEFAPPNEKWLQITEENTKYQEQLDRLVSNIKADFPADQVEGLEFDSLLAWLYTNHPDGKQLALLAEARLQVAKTEDARKAYSIEPAIFKSYIEEFRNRQWLGYIKCLFIHRSSRKKPLYLAQKN